MDNDTGGPTPEEMGFTEQGESKGKHALVIQLSVIRAEEASLIEKITKPAHENQPVTINLSLDAEASDPSIRTDEITTDLQPITVSYKELSSKLSDPEGEVMTQIMGSEIGDHLPFGSFSTDIRRGQEYIQKLVQAGAVKDLKQINTHLETEFPDQSSAIIQNGIVGDDKFGKDIAKSVLQETGLISERDALKYRSEVWHAIKASPILQEMFGEEIQDVDKEIEAILINKSTEKGAAGEKAAVLLAFYDPSPDVIRDSLKNLLSASLNNTEIATVLLKRYQQRPDWDVLIASAEESDPSLTLMRQLPARLSVLFEDDQYTIRQEIIRNADVILGDDSDFDRLAQTKAIGVIEVYLSRLIANNTQTDSERDRVLQTLNEQIALIGRDVPAFFSLLEPGGPLHKNRELVMQDVLKDNDFIRQAQTIKHIFTENIPYWQQVFMYTDLKVGRQLEEAATLFPVETLAIMRGTREGAIDLTDDIHFELQPISDLNLDQKEQIVDTDKLSASDVGRLPDLTEIPFAWLKPEYKKSVFAHLLSETLAMSRDDSYKEQADQRNRENARETLTIHPNIFIHGSSIDYLNPVLQNGNLPVEVIGEVAKTDAVPFQVDFVSLPQSFIDEHKDVATILTNTLSAKYGITGKSGADGQIFYLYDRKGTTWQDKRHPTHFQDHYVLLGGMPATETSGIVLRSPDISLELATREVVENGFYIPIYDMDGRLLLNPQQYDQIRTDYNMQIPVDVWDNALKIGEKMGSNPGGQYVIPTVEGPKNYYVKFLPEQDQMWNEQLADNIYSRFGIPVPKTKIVQLQGEYGHASEIVPLDEQVVDEKLKNGFIADAFLSNWDITKSDNVASADGQLLRLDNGGSLLFRANKGRKKIFGATVIELETMRGSYPGLTREDIQRQLATLRNTITDQAIDEEVDSVRLSKKDRDYLKTTLKLRREYILSYDFEGQAGETESNLTEQGKSVISLLEADTFDDTSMTSLVPEWQILIGEQGYQHNSVLLGEHLKDAVRTIKDLPEYVSLTEKERSLAVVAMLFHDIAKPTGRKDEQVIRDFEHEVPSAQLAAEYMMSWGFSGHDIKVVVQSILYDGVVSDIARGKVRDSKKNLSPDALKNVLSNESTIKVLRAVNTADVIATVGRDRFNEIAPVYNEFFDSMSR